MRPPDRDDELTILTRLRADEAALDRRIADARAEAARVVTEARAAADAERAAARAALARELDERRATAAAQRQEVLASAAVEADRRTAVLARHSTERFDEAVALVVRTVEEVT